MLLYYLATYPGAKLRYYTGNMQLHVESDAEYQDLPGAKSRIIDYYYLHSPAYANKTYPKNYNAPIHVECSTIKKHCLLNS